MVRLRVVDEDARTPAERAAAIHAARDSGEARERLSAVLDPLVRSQRHLEEGGETSEIWAWLDEAYAALDTYLAALLHEAEIDPRCGPRCSACCTDLPPILPVEALRMVRALRARPDRHHRIQRAVEQARGFQQVLLASGGGRAGNMDNTTLAYREAQFAWRQLGHPCPLLGDEGSCTAYAARPLSCRVHVHLEDPAHCEPKSPRFRSAERPPLWGHPRECEIELTLARIGKLLGLPGVANLQWGMAALHQHRLA